MHIKDSHLMVGLLVVGSVLFFSGIVSAQVLFLFLLWPLACVVMMAFMMRALMSVPAGGTKVDQVDQDDARPPVGR